MLHEVEWDGNVVINGKQIMIWKDEVTANFKALYLRGRGKPQIALLRVACSPNQMQNPELGMYPATRTYTYIATVLLKPW
jgi:prophage tail gpP-like protein